MKPVNKTKIRLCEGQMIFYWDGKTLIEQVEVKSVDKKEKTALLKNGILLDRYPNKEGVYPRKDKKKSKGVGAILLDTKFDHMFKAHQAKINIKNLLKDISVKVNQLHWQDSSDMDKLLDINKCLTRIKF